MKVKTTRISIIFKVFFVLITSIVFSTPALADVIIDNGDSGTSSTGTWSVSGGSSPYGTNSLFARPSATYTWQFSGQPAGDYEVLMWWTTYASRGTNISVDIHAAATSSVTVNQQENGGQWNSLGTFTFGTSGSVTITASSDVQADGTTIVSTCADAVRFRKVSDNGVPTAFIDGISPNPASSGETVSFSGHGEDSDGTVSAFSWTSNLDGQLSGEASFSTSALSDGTHEISFSVQDDRGAWSTSATQTLTVSNPQVDFIIDNGDAGTSSTGTWSVSGGSSPYGTNSLFARPSATYTWQFSGQPAGSYEVLMWWTTYASRGTNISVDINAAATSSVTVNQQENGGQWNSLGIFTFGTSGSATITASSDVQADGTTIVSTCADAVRFRKVSDNGVPTAFIDGISPNPAGSGETISFSGHGEDSDGTVSAFSWTSNLDGQLSSEASFSTSALSNGTHEISFSVQDDQGAWSTSAKQTLSVSNPQVDFIIDNGDSGTSSTGTWSVSSGSSPYGTNSLYARPLATYTWQFSGQSAGDYEVLMWWTPLATRGTNIAVDINASAQHGVIVNQLANGGQWNSLGTFTFGTSGSVTITASNDKQDNGNTVSTCADAVRFRKIDGDTDTAADLIIKDETISDTRAYDSDAGIIFDNVVMTATADVVAAASFELLLRRGTRVVQGARFVARMKDDDGLSNRCEMQYFGDLNEGPDGDFDGDGYTNLQECRMGTDPAFPEDIEDRDNDGLPDYWELQHFKNLDHNCNSDSNEDGVHDCMEYRLGRDPNATDSKGPGIYYQYDKLGRTRKIERIPSR